MKHHTDTSASGTLFSTHRVMKSLEIVQETWTDMSNSAVTGPESMVWMKRSNPSMVWTPDDAWRDQYIGEKRFISTMYREPTTKQRFIPVGEEVMVMAYHLPAGHQSMDTLVNVQWAGKRYLVRHKGSEQCLLPKGGIYRQPQTPTKELHKGKLYRVHFDAITIDRSYHAMSHLPMSSSEGKEGVLPHKVANESLILFVEYRWWEVPLSTFCRNADGYKAGGFMYKVIDGENIGWLGENLWVRLEEATAENNSEKA